MLDISCCVCQFSFRFFFIEKKSEALTFDNGVHRIKNEEEERSSLLKNKNLDLTIILYQGENFSTSKKLLNFGAFATENIIFKADFGF